MYEMQDILKNEDQTFIHFEKTEVKDLSLTFYWTLYSIYKSNLVELKQKKPKNIHLKFSLKRNSIFESTKVSLLLTFVILFMRIVKIVKFIKHKTYIPVRREIIHKVIC